MDLRKLYFVIDGDGCISWDAETEESESFQSKTAAIKRARELAEENPGKAVHIAETVQFIICNISDPVVIEARD